MLSKKRALRRYKTRLCAARRFTIRRKSGMWLPKSPHCYAKSHALQCGCTKKKRGAPKHGRGICYMDPRDTVKARRAWRKALARFCSYAELS